MIDKLKEWAIAAKDWLLDKSNVLEIHWNNAGNTESFDFKIGCMPAILIILAIILWRVFR